MAKQHHLTIGDTIHPRTRSALIVAAHPDDAEYNCAGLVGRLVGQGVVVRYLVLSDGEKGLESSDEAATRRHEQQLAAESLGVADVQFLGLPDGEIFDSLNTREAIIRSLRQHSVDLLITHDPLTRRYRQHPDHRAVGFAALAAAFPAAALASYHPDMAKDGIIPHRVLDAFLFSSDQPDCFIELDEKLLSRKIDALRVHKSQLDSFPGGLEQRVRMRATEFGQMASMQYAEAFVWVHLE